MSSERWLMSHYFCTFVSHGTHNEDRRQTLCLFWLLISMKSLIVSFGSLDRYDCCIGSLKHWSLHHYAQRLPPELVLVPTFKIPDQTKYWAQTYRSCHPNWFHTKYHACINNIMYSSDPSNWRMTSWRLLGSRQWSHFLLQDPGGHQQRDRQHQHLHGGGVQPGP